MEPTSQDSETIEDLVKNAIEKENDEKVKKELEEFFKERSMGINTAMRNTYNEIMNGGDK